MNKATIQMQQLKKKPSVSLYWYCLPFGPFSPSSSWCILISSRASLSLLCVMLQASVASTLWFRIWRWQRVGRRTWPAAWSIMTTPPSSGQTQHSRPSFLGTRKVSWRMSDSSSSSSSSHTKGAVLQSTLPVEKCSRKPENPLSIPVCLSLQLAATFVVS